MKLEVKTFQPIHLLMFEATFTLQEKSSNSKSIWIHKKVVLGFDDLLHRKK